MTEAVLSSRVLVLNRGFAPVRTTTVRNAMVKLFSAVAEAVTVEEGAYIGYDFHSWAEVSALRVELGDVPPETDWVRTPNLHLMVPRVIRLINYDKFPIYHVRLTRKNIYERDNYTCQYTGVRLKPSDLNIDHVLPRSRGGKNTWDNLVTCSVDANARKGGRTPDEAGMRLIRKPRRPPPRSVMELTPGQRRYRDWDHFVSDAYWNTELRD